MKYLLIILFSSVLTHADDTLILQKLKSLEERIKKLEQEKSVPQKTQLKTEDMNNKNVDVNDNVVDSSGGQALSDEKKAEIMNTLKKYQERKKEELKILEELDREDP